MRLNGQDRERIPGLKPLGTTPYLVFETFVTPGGEVEREVVP
jgi:hypothetical protein